VSARRKPASEIKSLRTRLREAESYWTLWFDECIESDVRATKAEAALAEAQKEIERLRKDPKRRNK
jgi:hypothetical protein